MRGERAAARWRRIAIVLVLALAASAPAATIVVVNNDGPNEGFNDPTLVPAVGGNPGTTLGAQRLNAFRFAADLWASALTSTVTIQVDATMDPLPCSASTATLGQASPTTVLRDFPGAAFPGTWYPVALANQLAGFDLAASDSDITAQFSSVVGTTCALPTGWYYGFDGAAPASTLDFVTVVFHELGHGLGFETFVDPDTGAELMSHPDVFERNLQDDGVSWLSMTSTQRQASTIHTGHLVWSGPTVTENAGILTAGRNADGLVLMYAPSVVSAGSSVSHWDTSLSPDQLLEPFYTHPIHDPSLTLDALVDIGWTAGSTTVTTTPGGTTTSTTLPTGCPAVPDTDCSAANRSALRIAHRVNTARNALRWNFHGGGGAASDFGDPTTAGATFHLCLYDASAQPQLVVTAAIPSGGQCRARACWRALGKAKVAGFMYKNVDATPDGVVTAKLRARASGATQIVVAGRGSNLALPSAQLTSPVTIELRTDDGAGGARCWQSTFQSQSRAGVARFQSTTP